MCAVLLCKVALFQFWIIVKIFYSHNKKNYIINIGIYSNAHIKTPESVKVKYCLRKVQCIVYSLAVLFSGEWVYCSSNNAI